MALVIIFSIILIVLIGVAIYTYKEKTYNHPKFTLGMFIFFILLIIGAIIFQVFYTMKGPFPKLVNEYGMEYHEDFLGGDQHYSKEDLTINIDTGKTEDKYEILDGDDPDLDIHTYVLNNFIQIDKNTLSLITQYLHDISREQESVKHFIIEGNHCRVEISFNYPGKSMIYKITKENPYYTEGSGDDEVTVTNPDYAILYVRDKIEIPYYDEKYNDTYKEIITKMYKYFYEYKYHKDGSSIIYYK